MQYILPPLPYKTDALEPFYSQSALENHHGRHHALYVERLNDVVATSVLYDRADSPGNTRVDHELGDFGRHSLSEKTVEQLLCDPDSIPDEIRDAVMDNGGGHANHSLFWQIMGAAKGGEPKGEVGAAIQAEFGSFPAFRQHFTESAVQLFGSGWVFLVQNQDGHLEICALPNQQSPITRKQKPLLLIDVWEHAYYLQFQNLRAEWIDSWWNLVDWERVNALYAETPAWLAVPVAA